MNKIFLLEDDFSLIFSFDDGKKPAHDAQDIRTDDMDAETFTSFQDISLE